ncbi:EF-hand domain-containing protein [Luteimonas terrae]|nr:EF-hand domain-containing protein [Luteimonas terrae]
MRRHRCLVVSIPLMLCAATAVASPDVDRIFAEQDRNGDGVITQAESRAGAARDFRKLDTNGDGVLVAAEVNPRVTSSSPGGTGFPPEAQAALLDATMRLWDVNGDGRITLAEMQQTYVASLLSADHDGDGQVSREELGRFHQGVIAPPR